MPRPKKIVNEISLQHNDVVTTNNDTIDIENNIIQEIQEIQETQETQDISSSIPITKSKRGRKSKKDIALMNNKNNTENDVNDNIILSQNQEIIVENNESVLINAENNLVPVAKKRGRKPKGGKIIQQISSLSEFKENKPNIILHLKCSMKDLQNNVFDDNVNGYNLITKTNELSYEIISNNDVNLLHNSYNKNSNNNLNIDIQYNKEYLQNTTNTDDDDTNKHNETKNIWKKLKILQHNLHINNTSDKKSACFWCTYEFDNPPIYIPKHFIKDSYHVYGCFCSPECGTAFLMEENLDTSTKFERYHLLNHIYSKIYDYKKNIKPAPKPYYMLEKFYGNLNIQEYRSLLKNERLFLVVDKPLTRILPELHEENDDFIINNKIIPSNTYQIKRKMMQKQSKNNIVNEHFGIHA